MNELTGNADAEPAQLLKLAFALNLIFKTTHHFLLFDMQLFGFRSFACLWLALHNNGSGQRKQAAQVRNWPVSARIDAMGSSQINSVSRLPDEGSDCWQLATVGRRLAQLKHLNELIALLSKPLNHHPKRESNITSQLLLLR